MDVLVTGGEGFIGKKLVSSLLASGKSVIVIDSLDQQVHGVNINIEKKRGYKLIHDNLKNIKKYKSSLENVEEIYHLASETGTYQSMSECARYVSGNDLSTAILMDTIGELKKVKKIILTSSRSVYGEGAYENKNNIRIFPKARSQKDLERGIWDHSCHKERLEPKATKEIDALNPVSIYGANKLNQENLVAIKANYLGIESVIFRLQNVYGPGQSLVNPYTGLMTFFFNALNERKEINVYEDGKIIRDFVYVSDVVDMLMKNDLLIKNNINILNVGTGVPTAIVDLAKIMIKKINIEGKFRISGDYRLGDVRSNYADMTAAHEIYGKRKFITLDEGIDKFIEWAKEESKKNENKFHK